MNKMKRLVDISEYVDLFIEKVQNQLDKQEPRDRLAIIILVIFLVVASVVGTVWFTHKAALYQQQRLIELKENIQWMQTNAGKLSPQQDIESISAADKVRRIAQQQSLSIQSQENQDQLQISMSHQNYAVLANFLTEIARQGVTIVSIDMQKQDSGEILLSGVVQ